MKHKNIKNTDKINIIPLGGLHEFGKNLTIYEYKNEIIIIDCGLMFSSINLLGVDYVINDLSYLKSNRDKILALFITHGHLDHIGGIPFLLKELDIPIYATQFTKALLQNFLSEYQLKNNVVINEISSKEKIILKNFTVDPIDVNHSIRDSVGFAITTPAGTIIHTGDFKIDNTPLYENCIDLNKFSEYGKQGVLALLSDSTNSISSGYSLSESELSEDFEDIFTTAKGRIIIATFASQINRIKHIIQIAKTLNKKVAICGRSLLNNINISMSLNILDDIDTTFVDIFNINNIDDEKLIIITTGSQGEPDSGLTQISEDRHKFIKLKPNDTIIFSSSNIPANELNISKVINNLYKRNIKVHTNKDYDIHASGHAKQLELKFLLNLIKPEYFIPIHGESMMLFKHKEIADELQIKNTLILENGIRLELSKNGFKFLDKLKSKDVYVEEKLDNNLSMEIIQERETLSENGVISIVIILSSNTITDIIINSKGFINRSLNEELFINLQADIEKRIMREFGLFKKEDKQLLISFKKQIKNFIYEITKKNPSIFLNFINKD